MIAHHVTAKMRETAKAGYVSSLTCTGSPEKSLKQFSIVWKKDAAPAVGTVLRVSLTGLTKHGIPTGTSVTQMRKPTDMEDILSRELSKMNIKSRGVEDALIDVPKWTMEKLAKSAPLKLKRGDKMRVPDSRGEGWHTLTVSGAGKIYCSCPGWRFQKKPTEDRSCKHCQAVSCHIVIEDV